MSPRAARPRAVVRPAGGTGAEERLAAHPAARIRGLDLARGLAVLGMFAAHMRLGEDLHPDPRTWSGVVDGRSSILFATLAGVSVALLSGRTEPPAGRRLTRVRWRIAIRAAWVAALGWLLTAMDTFVAVILGVYGVLFLLVLPFLRWPVRRLLVLAAFLAVVVPPLLVALGQAVTAAGAQDALLPSLLVTGTYPALLWLVFVLVGLAVGRSDLASGAVRARLAAAGAVAAVGGYGGGLLSTELLASGIPSAGPGTGFDDVPGAFSVRWLTGAEPHSGTTFEVVGSTGVAVLVIAACLLLAERLPGLLAPPAAVGALALSVYTAHLVAIRVLMDVAPGSAQGLRTWLWLAGVALAGATAWRSTVGRGPLEWLVTWTSTRATRLPPSSAAA